MLLEEQLRFQYALLKHEGFYTRVRVAGGTYEKTANKGQEDYVKGIDDVIKYLKPFAGRANCYLSRNPFTKNGQVAGISGFSIDVDKIRDPKDRATTDSEFRDTVQVAQEIRRSLGEGNVCTSGNGCLLIVPYPELVTDDLEMFVYKSQEFEHLLIDKFSTSEVRIDATNYAKALVRAMGTVNVKDATAPCRYARFLHRPIFSTGRSFVLDGIRQNRVGQSSIGSTVQQLDGSLNDARDAHKLLAPERKTIGIGPAARLLLAESSLKRLSPERANSYDDWLKVGIALKEFGPAGFELWKQWSDAKHSKERERFTTAGMYEKWRSFKDDQSLTVGTLKYWADTDGEDTMLQGSTVWTPTKSDITTYIDGIRRRGEAPDGDRLLTGFSEIDAAIYELPKGEISTFVARSGFGKTSVACCIAEFNRKRNKRVLIFSTETEHSRILNKLCGIGASIPEYELTSGRLSERSWKSIGEYGNSLGVSPIYIYDNSQPTLENVRDKVKEIKPVLFIFYHINWIASDRVGVRTYAQGLKAIAKEFNVPCLLFAQLNEPQRDLKNGGIELTPVRSDIRESKDLITDSAVMVMWFNDGSSDGSIQPVTFVVCKGRFGGMQTEGNLQVNKLYGRFENVGVIPNA